jgi:excisionase family DNA binding protein
MAEWIGTSQAALLLGTSTTTVRAMAERGELVHRTEDRPQRSRWSISRSSVDAWLQVHGRVDAQRARRRRTASENIHRPGTVGNELAQTVAERDSLREEVAALRSAALHLRARHAAVETAHEHERVAGRLLSEALAEQQAATDQLRMALSSSDDALVQFLIGEASDTASGSRRGQSG